METGKPGISSGVYRENPPTGLRPQFSPLGMWAFSLGTSIGWGSFIVTCNTYLQKSGLLGTVFGLLIGMAVILVITWNLQYMIRTMPGAGGIYSFEKKVGGKDLGFLAFWFVLLTYLAILWANMTSLPLFARFFLGDLFRFGFCYTIFGYQVWLGEALLSMCALLLIGLLLLAPSLLPFHAVATESYALFIIWSEMGLIYFRTLLRRDRHNEHEQRLVVWAFLLILILFAAMMWVSRHTEIAANDAVDRIYAYHQAHPEHDSLESQEERTDFLREQAKSVSSTNTLYTMVSLGLFLVIFTMLLNNFLGDSRHGQGGRKENPDHRADGQRL